MPMKPPEFDLYCNCMDLQACDERLYCDGIDELKAKNADLKEHIWLSDNQSCAPEWIPVSSGRLPDPHVEVAVLTKSEDKSYDFPNAITVFYKEIGWINGIGKWNTLYQLGNQEVTHWFPLPDNPTEDL